MKITDEMVDTAVRPQRMRAALESAQAEFEAAVARGTAAHERCHALEAKLAEMRVLLYGWLKGAQAAHKRGQLPVERFDELIDMLKLEPPPCE